MISSDKTIVLEKSRVNSIKPHETLSDADLLDKLRSKPLKRWQLRLKENLSSIEDLDEFISKEDREAVSEIIEIHPASVSRYYAGLINKNDHEDPIKKMIIPSVCEMDMTGTYDTSGEKQNTKLLGLQHKYAQTALVLTTNKCSSYCRYCFRKRLVGLPNNEVLEIFNDAVDYVREHREITNVLLSGGDPLVLPTEIIEKFLHELTSIQHLKYIRIGSRVPVMFPYRITEDDDLIYLFRQYSKKEKRLHIVTHFNHPNEITDLSTLAISRLINSGMVISNQTVLLNGVNADPETLIRLFKNLVRIGINPYYLFQCRPVRRVKSHFQVPLYQAINIVRKAKSRLDGLSKRFRYCMSHVSGKIEIIGIMDDYFYFKYHQAKDIANAGKFFRKKLDKSAGWLEEEDPASDGR